MHVLFVGGLAAVPTVDRYILYILYRFHFGFILSYNNLAFYKNMTTAPASEYINGANIRGDVSNSLTVMAGHTTTTLTVFNVVLANSSTSTFTLVETIVLGAVKVPTNSVSNPLP